MPNQLNLSADRVDSSHVIEFFNPVTQTWMEGMLASGTSDTFQLVMTGITAGVYTGLRCRLKDGGGVEVTFPATVKVSDPPAPKTEPTSTSASTSTTTPASTPTPAGTGAYLTNQRLKLPEAWLFQKNNVSVANLFPVLTLSDGDFTTEYHPSDATMLNSPHVMVFDIPAGWDLIPRAVELYDGAGQFLDTPTTISFLRRDTGALSTGVSWNGDHYNELRTYQLDGGLQVVSDQIVIVGVGINNYPTDLTLICDHRDAAPIVYQRTPTPFKNVRGINMFYWNVLQDNQHPDHSAVFQPKLDLLASTFTIARIFHSTYYGFPAEGQVAYEPLQDGWTLDSLLTALKDKGLRAWLVTDNMPRWMQAGYPSNGVNQYGQPIYTWTTGDTLNHPDDWVPVRYSDLGKKDSVAAYHDFVYQGEQEAIRYGSNANASTASTVLWQSPQSYQPRNVVKVGLNLVRDMERGNEQDKDWRQKEGNMNGPQFYAFQKANYDRIKAIDSSLRVICGGMGRPLTDLFKEVYYLAKAAGDLNADGSVRLPWDVDNWHLYPKSNGANQYGSSGRGYAIAADADPLYGYLLGKMVDCSNRYHASAEIMITECGGDLHPNSPLAVVPVSGKTAGQVQGDIIARNALYFKEMGVDTVCWYNCYDDNSDSAGQFDSSGLLASTLNSDGTYTYSRRPAARYLVQLGNVLDEYVPAQVLTSSPQRISRWSRAGHPDAYALRLTTHTGATATYTLGGLTPGATATIHTLNPNADADLTTTQVVSSGGSLTLQLTETPILISF